jgi:hypothetical protein
MRITNSDQERDHSLVFLAFFLIFFLDFQAKEMADKSILKICRITQTRKYYSPVRNLNFQAVGLSSSNPEALARGLTLVLGQSECNPRPHPCGL